MNLPPPPNCQGVIKALKTFKVQKQGIWVEVSTCLEAFLFLQPTYYYIIITFTIGIQSFSKMRRKETLARAKVLQFGVLQIERERKKTTGFGKLFILI